MPSGETMPVAERFVSINGEGLRAGQLSAFVRFAGCDLSCSYCDTAWARDVSAAAEHMMVEEVVEWAFGQPTACITLTGGEPLEQPLFADLVAALLARDGGHPRTIEVETNGAQDLSALIALRKSIPVRNGLSFTLDCKLPSSGMQARMRPENYEMLGADDAVKFVCGGIEDLRAARSVIEAHGLAARTNVLLGAIWGALEPAAIVDFMKENAMIRERVQLQLHKIVWPTTERGV